MGSKKMRVMVVDGDVLVYTVVSACQERFTWERDEITNYVDIRRAKQSADTMLSEWKRKLKCTDIYIAISDHKHNWRKLLLPSYKAQRTKEKPMGYYELEQYLMDTYTACQFDGLEGDDVCSMYATEKRGPECVMVSVDKDFRGVPAPQWNQSLPDDPIYYPTLAQANYFHLFQTLMGDKVDNYDGCPGIGAVKAAKILDPFYGKDQKTFDVEGAWGAVVETYKKSGLTEQQALVQARVARILRSNEFDYDNNKPILWSP